VSFFAEPGIAFSVGAENPPVKKARLASFISKTNGFDFDASQYEYNDIEFIQGSENNDKLIGNSGANKFNGSRGDDYIEGGNGQDHYVMQKGDGDDTINNYAEDQLIDVLFLDANKDEIYIEEGEVTFEEHLTISTPHFTVRLQSWFESELYQHLVVFSADYYILELAALESCRENKSCLSVTRLDASNSQNGIYINLTKTEFETTNQSPNDSALLDTVTQNLQAPTEANSTKLFHKLNGLQGSQYDDILVGTNENNKIVGNKGNDYMEGRSGSDIYVVNKGDGFGDIINNFAEDHKTDYLLLDANLEDLIISNKGDNLTISTNYFIVTLQNWFLDQDYQHLVVATNDFFTARLSVSQLCIKDDSCIEATGFDASNSKIGVNLDLTKPLGAVSKRDTIIITPGALKAQLLSNTDSVIGSDYDDTLVCNDKNNMISPGAGNDYLQGGEGSDYYFISYPSVTTIKLINNSASDEALDYALLRDVNFKDVTLNKSKNDLVLKLGQLLTVTVLEWFSNNRFQHVEFKTADGFSFMPSIDSFDLEPESVVVPEEDVSSYFSLLSDINEEKCKNETCSKRVFGCTVQDQTCWSDRSTCPADRGTLFHSEKLKTVSASSNCGVIEGNRLSNYIVFDGKSILLKGKNGSDTYAIHTPNQDQRVVIDNFAEDEETDHLNFDVDFSSLQLGREGNNLTLKGKT
jgi:Ca2+-binding RTX toxin-like protein